MLPFASSQFDATATHIAWDECACLLCGSAAYTPILESADRVTQARFLIVRCNRCALCFTNPRPDAESIHAFYPDEYRCHQRKEVKRRRRSDPMASILPVRGQARLLDFGCGGGAFLERMAAIGWNVTGLDSSDLAIAQLRERGLSAHVGTLPQRTWNDASFEAITMWQSLEHTHQPLDVLCEANRLLTPDGTLLVAVPNFDSWASRNFRADWYGLDLPRHLTHFTPSTLQFMLENAGFVHVDIRQETHASWIRHSARGITGLAARWLRSRLGSTLAGWWGGTQARSDGLLAIARKK